MKKEDSPFKELHLLMLPDVGRTLIYENELVLLDNIGMNVEEELVSDFVSPSYPFKVTFTLVMFCLCGTMRVRLQLKEYVLSENDVLVVLPGTIGECLEVSAEAEVAIIGLSGHHLLAGQQSSLSMAFLKFLTATSLIHISSEQMGEYMMLYHLMRKKLEQPDYQFKLEAIAGYLQVFFYNGCQWLLEYDRQKVCKVESRQEKLFEAFLELVQTHYRTHRNMCFYAEKLCLTPKYLSQVIGEVSDRHAPDWIRDYVILEAKALLKSGQYTVQQVGDLLNFANASFFGKYFKAAVGYTPRQYMLR